MSHVDNGNSHVNKHGHGLTRRRTGKKRDVALVAREFYLATELTLGECAQLTGISPSLIHWAVKYAEI